MTPAKRAIARTGVEAAGSGTGGGPFGDPTAPTADAEAPDVIEGAGEAGSRLFDPAPVYGLGLSERRLRPAPRELPTTEAVVSTEVGRLLRPDPGRHPCRAAALHSYHRREEDMTKSFEDRKRAKASAVKAGLLLTAGLIAADAAAAREYKVGYSSPFLTDPGQVVQVDFARKAAEKEGVTLLSPTNANGDAAKQVTDIRNLVSAGAQAIIVGATDSQAIVPAVNFANSKNVPVVATDIPPNGGKLYMIVRADNKEMGAEICDAMGKALGGKGKVLSLMGDQANAAGRDRTVGFNECMAANHPGIEVIERPTYWKPERATATAQTIVTATPDLSAIYMQSDSIMLAGVMSVLKSADRLKKAGEEGHIYLASIDGTPRALQGVRDGYLDIVVSQPLDQYAQRSVYYAKAALDGKTFAEGPTDHGSVIKREGENLRDVLPSTVVTSENASDPNLWGNGAAK